MRARLAVAAVATVALAACGGGDTAGIEIDGAWARTSPAMVDTGAAYMKMTAAEADALVSASVDASVAGTVEIHEVVPVDTGMADDSMTDDSIGDHSMSDDSIAEGMEAMMMQEIEELTLPAGELVSLEPGGCHIMLFDLPDPLETGETFDLTLTFANAGELVVSVEVREDAP